MNSSVVFKRLQISINNCEISAFVVARSNTNARCIVIWTNGHTYFFDRNYCARETKSDSSKMMKSDGIYKVPSTLKRPKKKT